MKILSSLKEGVLDLLFPRLCLQCGAEGKFVCELCKKTLNFVPPACFLCGKLTPSLKRAPSGRTCKACRPKTKIDYFVSPFSFRNEFIRELIHNFKYDRVKDLGQELVILLLEYLAYYKIDLPKNSHLVPIPLHPRRERKRGFNQSELIARHLSDILDIPLKNKCLFRVKNTKPQIELDAEKRKLNPAGAFVVRNSPEIARKIIVLVDDVKTTGSTMEEAAKVLKEAGAEKIWALTIVH